MSNAVPWSTDVRTIGRPERDVDGLTECQQLHRNQPLVVIARDDHIELAALGAHEHRVARETGR